jgi:stage III sporulation protein AD
MIKIVILAVVGVVFIVLLKEKTSALSFLLMLSICMLIMFQVLDYSMILLEGFKVFEAYFDSNGYYIKIILKMVGVTYLCELGTQICKDVGQGTIAFQVELFGKIMVLIIGLPILLSIIEQLVTFEG